MQDNILRILGVQHREDSITNLLQYGFERSEPLRNALLSLTDSPTTGSSWTVRVRPQTPAGTPDLVLIHDDPSNPYIVVIENKMGAQEGQDQTLRYAEDSCVDALIEDARNAELESASCSYLYLTLFPNQKPRADEFDHATYEDLLESLAIHSEGTLNDNALAGRLINDLCSLLTQFYSRAQISPDDVVLDRLRDYDGLDAGYLYFQRLFDSDSGVALPEGLEVHTFFRSKKRGRHYYGTKFSKPQWNPGGMESTEDGLSFVPNRDFQVHFEPQYDVLQRELKLALHYEPDPYRTRDWMRSNVPGRLFELHEDRKGRVREGLRRRNIPQFKYSNYYLQIAKAEIDFEGKTLAEVKSEVEPVLTHATHAIDEVLESLD